VRRLVPVFLTGVLVAVFVPAATASVPTAQVTSKSRPFETQIDSRTRRDLSRGLNESLDPHPFTNEFYLLQFASETTAIETPQQRSSWFSPVLNPVTNAATLLSKKVASLRHALARMMP
jgi:hypothetical protein